MLRLILHTGFGFIVLVIGNHALIAQANRFALSDLLLIAFFCALLLAIGRGRFA